MLELYESRIADARTSLKEAEARSLKASNRRGLVFFGAIACALIGRYAPVPGGLSIALYALCPLLLIVFIVLVFSHRRISDAIDRARFAREANEQGLARLQRRWDDFPVPATPAELRDNTTANDLDLFGKASLFQLVSTAGTPGGRERLADWLIHPTDPEDAAGRQKAIAELAPMLDWRQELQFAGKELSQRERTAETMPVREQPEGHWPGAGLMWVAKLLPVVMIGLGIAHGFGLFSKPWWLFPLVASFLINKFAERRIIAALGDIRREELALLAYSRVFAKLEELDAKSDWLAQRRSAIDGAHAAVDQISNYATSHAARGSIVYPLLRYCLMWDFHLANGVAHWHEAHSEHVHEWFEALAEIEAAAAIANLHHDEPDWEFPQFSDEKSIMAKQIGHPLIAPDVRVCNDLEIDPPGKFLLVTGSNMSGKSTLLRSLGLNLCLGQAGAPTCTEAFRIPPLAIVTSLRVEDSLAEGTSFFMAELKRIKSAVQLADAPPEGRTVLYLFDEILRGTNSVERQAIVQGLLGHLLKCDAIGAITTHDLALAEIEELKPAARAVHFRESFEETENGPQMTFDYQLREGLATTTNAIKLLEMIDLKL